ncbi:MAG: hypothetical protein N3A61_00755, partial [Ignavibacteria bacterium]|nr:hypothetical protein [Ignavibacteria bacterium]
MKWVLLLFIVTVPFAIAQPFIQITELRGLDDQFGKTHLFYRAGSDTNIFNPVYHFDLDSNKIRLFLDAFYINYPPWLGGTIYLDVREYEFWRNNPNYYIYCGTMLYPDNHVYISRFDNLHARGNFGYDNLEISSQNDSIVYSGKPLYKSTTGGRLWEFVSYLNLVGVSKLNDQILFLNDENYRLRKSTDGGVTSFYSEITGKWDCSDYNSKLYFDADGVHIYGVTDKKIFISSDGGEIWNLVFISQKDIKFSHDPNQSGRFCFAEGKNIYISNNYGQTFSIFKRLNRDIVGIHLKSNSNKIYAATQSQILEISIDTIKSLKDFPLPDYVLNYYPLHIRNKWYFNTVDIDQSVHPPVYTYGFLTREIIKDSLADNGKRYYLIQQIQKPTGSVTYFLERIDSTTGLVYRYEKTILPSREYVIDDLLATVSDTLTVNRFFAPGSPYVKTIFSRIDTIQFAGKDYVRKFF